MKKKAFTLIDLLAVIIILAIVALIATPIILDVVEDARISAGKSEANMILNGINNYCASEDMKYELDNNYTRICTKDMDENNVTSMVNLGNSKITSVNYIGNKITKLEIESNNYTFKLCPNGKFVMVDEECSSLIGKLLKQYQEGNQTGLVKDSNNENIYYYTGKKEEVSNNFLWYGGHQWRVLEFDTSNNIITLITQQPLTALQPASTAWTTKEAYESSYINTWLNDYFWNSLDSSIQSNIIDNTFNIGIYSDVDEITTDQKVGLLDENQYLRAGSKTSFLNIKDCFWLENRYSSSEIRNVSNNGDISNGSVSDVFGVRVVIKISDITITEGDGTLTDSFRATTKVTDTSEIQVGEYINVPYSGSDNACGNDNMCTFRVVSKNNDSIKVVLNGLLSKTSAWADISSDNIITNDLIYTNVLNGFIENIDSKYITTGTYGVGMYEAGNSYTIPQSTTITASVGLPTVGEMFSGNDIDIGTSNNKVSVDVNTIENPNIGSYYWLMNKYKLSFPNLIHYDGKMLGDTNSMASLGVRPVIYLKSGNSSLTFTGGKGTAQLPYTLE